MDVNVCAAAAAARMVAKSVVGRTGLTQVSGHPSLIAESPGRIAEIMIADRTLNDFGQLNCGSRVGSPIYLSMPSGSVGGDE